MSEYEQMESAYRKIPNFKNNKTKYKKSTLVYQYRNLKSFWQILESDSFWATNARFSNDEAEQQFGKAVIASLCKNGNIFEDLGLDENYIICFCNEDDKLSQWRGYASEGGVSMGFDFNMPRAFSVLKKSVSNDTIVLTEDNCVVQYVELDDVRYIKPENDKIHNMQYVEYCKDELELLNIPSDEDEKKIYQEEIRKKAPYIKHSGFSEEDECRLVFRNNGDIDDCIKYKDSASELLKYPYIVVKPALPKDKEEQCVVRIAVSEMEEENLVKEIQEELNKTIPDVVVKGCHLFDGVLSNMEENFCTGCILRCKESNNSFHKCRYDSDKYDVKYEYSLPDDVNSIVISQGKNQEEVFGIVHKVVQKYNKNTISKKSVWCEGHLPLRKITVGPCINQDSVVEAIQHYCKHTYWLRDVEIAVSSIPFRKSL